MMVRHSKLQKQVLSLYREFMRLGKSRPGLSDYVRNEFKKNAEIPKLNTIQIEQTYRRGQRQLRMLKQQEVQSVGVFKSK